MHSCQFGDGTTISTKTLYKLMNKECAVGVFLLSMYEGAVNVIVTYSVMIVQNIVFCTYQLYFNKFSINTDCV